MFKAQLKNINISDAQVAAILFKDHKHPLSALRYLVSGRRELKVSEHKILSELKNLANFNILEYTLIFNTESKEAWLFKNDKCVLDGLTLTDNLTVEVLLETINKFISAYENE